MVGLQAACFAALLAAEPVAPPHGPADALPAGLVQLSVVSAAASVSFSPVARSGNSCAYTHSDRGQVALPSCHFANCR